MARPCLGEMPMTAAQRKARQRIGDALRRRASAENLDSAIIYIFKKQCEQMSSGLLHRSPELNELVQMVAQEFPLHERPKIFGRLGLEFEHTSRILLP